MGLSWPGLISSLVWSGLVWSGLAWSGLSWDRAGRERRSVLSCWLAAGIVFSMYRYNSFDVYPVP